MLLFVLLYLTGKFMADALEQIVARQLNSDSCHDTVCLRGKIGLASSDS